MWSWLTASKPAEAPNDPAGIRPQIGPKRQTRTARQLGLAAGCSTLAQAKETTRAKADRGAPVFVPLMPFILLIVFLMTRKVLPALLDQEGNQEQC